MRDVLDLGGVSLLRVASLSELTAEDCDVHEMIAVIDQRLKGGIVQSPRVEWFMDITAPTLQERFVGNHRRKLKKTYEQVAHLGITFEYAPVVTRELFLQFLSVYRDIIGHKEHPRFRLSENSFDDLQKYPLHGVWVFRNGEFLGGSLIRDYGEYYAISYSAFPQFDRKELETGLGAPLFDQAYQRSVAEGRKKISYGMDTNMYGFHLSTGLLEYKLSIGCAPASKDLDGLTLQTVFIMRTDAHTLAWYEEGMKLSVATNVSQNDLKQHFSHAESAHAVSSLSELVASHRNTLQQYIQ